MKEKESNDTKKEEPFLNEAKNEQNLDNNILSKEKERKVLSICLCIAIIILIIGGILSYRAAHQNIKKINKDINSNILILKYYNNILKEYKLFDTSHNNISNYIKSIKIDEKIVNYVEKFNFSDIGEHTVEINLNKNISSLYMFFKNCDSLISVDFSYFNSENINNLGELFSGCSSLSSINFTNFNTSKVYNMSYMFSNCNKLTSIDLDMFDTFKTLDMSGMFNNNNKLENLNLSNFDTTQVTNMNNMFYNCKSLNYLNLKNFDTKKVNNMSSLFYNCKSLSYLDISNFYYNSSNGYNNMFNNIGKKGIVIYRSNKFLLPNEEFELWTKRDLAYID